LITDRQVRRLFSLMKTEGSLELAASKAGMDAKTARKYRRVGRLPSELESPERWRTRPDPFAGVWEAVRGLLENSPGLEAKTVFEHLQRLHPGRFQNGQLRTLQRKVKQWRAIEGPSREVFFSQQHHPGRLCASDFTHMEELGVMVQGQSFSHLIYHFVLTYSNWEAGTVCFSESFESLSEGLQNALWELGKIPERHRTDRLSTAVNNTVRPAEFTERYEGLMRYHGLTAEKIQAGHGNENGDVEQRHHRFKRAVEQELLLRGSRDFTSVDAYRSFLQVLFARLNAGRRHRLAEEIAVMRELPERRMESAKRERVKVDSGSLIYVDRNVYSVPSRLIGEVVEARLTMDQAFAGDASTAWTIVTSSTGWCASRARSRTTVTVMSCSRPAASAWSSMRLKSGMAGAAARSIYASWNWRPGRASPGWMKRCARCCITPMSRSALKAWSRCWLWHRPRAHGTWRSRLST
jgi:hypothetical protein